MKQNAILYICYGVLLILGGFIGFFMAHSWMSLLSGLIIGSSIVFTGYRTFQSGGNWEFITMGAILLMNGFFSYRFYLTYSFMPAGLFILLGTAIILIAAFNTKNRVYSTHSGEK